MEPVVGHLRQQRVLEDTVFLEKPSVGEERHGQLVGERPHRMRRARFSRESFNL